MKKANKTKQKETSHAYSFTTKIEAHVQQISLVLEAIDSSPRNIGQVLMLGDTERCQL